MRVYGPRLAATVAMLLVVAAMLVARVAAAPTADGYRHAIAGAPNGGLFAVEGNAALLVSPSGTANRIGTTLGGLPLALAADGDRLLLGTDRDLQLSNDGGRTWRRAGPGGRYPAVLLDGELVLGGSWSAGLEVSRDGGVGWERLRLPGSNEIEALAESSGPTLYAATLTGLDVSGDGGRSWRPIAVGGRVTALHADLAGATAGTWRGRIYRALGGDASPIADVGAGIWALAGRFVATTDGLRGTDDATLRHAEVTALVASGAALYAGVARGPLYVSGDGGASWRAVQSQGQL